MPTIYDLKPAFQRLLVPACQLLEKQGISPNQITVATVVLCAAQGILIIFVPESRIPFLFMPMVLLMRMALNAIDGMMAVRLKQKTRMGAVLNEMGDILSDCLLYLPLALAPVLNPILVFLAVIVGIMVEMMGVVAIQIGSSRRYDGPLGKSDRAFLFGLVALLIGLGVRSELWLNSILVGVLLLSAYTLYNRGRKALSESDK